MMFNRLRKRFICIAMIAVFTALFALSSCINVANRVKGTLDNDVIVSWLIEDDGSFAREMLPGRDDGFKFGKPISNETPYESRFFSIRITEKGYLYDLSKINSINEEQANAYIAKALKKSKQRGYIDNYRYGFNEDRTLIVFLDCSKTIRFNYVFLSFSVFFSMVVLLLSFFFIYFFSKKILMPVKDSYEKQKKFITNASHELKTPLTIISANNELIEMQNGENNYSKNINDQIGKMNKMVKELTTLAKIDENEAIEFEQVNLSLLLDSIIETFTPLIKQANKKLNTNIEKDLYSVSNPTILTKVISIIFDNAIKYSQSEISIFLYTEGNSIVLVEENDCSFIKEGDLSYLTERFYRDDASRSNISGHGIGLSILKDSVKMLNGKLLIEGRKNNYRLEIKLKSKKL